MRNQANVHHRDASEPEQTHQYCLLNSEDHGEEETTQHVLSAGLLVLQSSHPFRFELNKNHFTLESLCGMARVSCKLHGSWIKLLSSFLPQQWRSNLQCLDL